MKMTSGKRIAVNPARAGMILRVSCESGLRCRKPRASGDDPKPLDDWSDQ